MLKNTKDIIFFNFVPDNSYGSYKI